MDLEELEFFKEGRELDEILEEFGRVRGVNILKEFIEEGFVDKKEGLFKLTQSGEKKVGKKSETSNGALKVFLSHSVRNYEIAKEIKRFLEQFGLDVFLAHSDIVLSKDFVEEIYSNLKKCHIFIPLLTKEFKTSEWTDQESGIVYNLGGKTIVPLMIENVKPYGFLSGIQALRFNTKKFSWKDDDSRIKIVEHIVETYFGRMREPLIQSLNKTISCVISKIRFKFLKKMESNESFTREEVNKIIKEGIENNKIYDAEGIKNYFSELIEKYRDEIEPHLKNKAINKIENDRAREMLGGKSEAGQPILYGKTPEENLELLKGYGGKVADEMREEIRKEIRIEEKKPSLVKGTKDGL